MVKRRDFLKSAGLTALTSAAPNILQQTAQAALRQNDPRILVVIQLSGGNDGLNTVVPFNDPSYQKLRPELKLDPDDVLRIADGIGLHPRMKSAADLFEHQRLSIIQGVGYPNPSRSHDVSMATWHTARTDERDHTGLGWLGRATDRLPAPARHAPQSILVSDAPTPPALSGRRSVSATFESLEELQAPDSPLFLPASPAQQNDGLEEFLQQTTRNVRTTASLLQDLNQPARSSRVVWPDSSLAHHLQVISQLIQADFRTPVYYAMQGGYDTHASQAYIHARLLNELAESLKAFLDELAAAGLEDRVLVLCFSEFGRQVQENGSMGTDHGTAGPVFLAGSRIIPGLHGEAPDLSQLSDNAPQHTTDFRQVYAGVLQDWLQIPPSEISGEDFVPLKLVR